MFAFLVRRIATIIPTLIFVSMLIFGLQHLLPGDPAVVLACPFLILAIALAAFLGPRQQPPVPSWGSMLNTAKNYVDNAQWMAIWPGVSIFVLVLSFNLVGDGLRDALDPRHA
jgi:peptide/nickel transport system permease protein